MTSGELFVEDIGGLWQCGPVVKLDPVTMRPDAPQPTKMLVCRLVVPHDDLKRIATSILQALGENSATKEIDVQPERTAHDRKMSW
jgi:hypothetical protein